MIDENKTILVVDDNSSNLKLIASWLKTEYRLLLANTGEMALITAREELPDLILLDVMLPDISGYEVCQSLKRAESTSVIPIIFVTARTSGKDIEQAYENGGVDYIAKPINLQELAARVKVHLLIFEQQKHLELMNAEIRSMNNNLEKIVHERTADLEKALVKIKNQNRDVEQAANIISHKLRAPVANILGLMQIMNHNNWADPANEEICNNLTIATENLDKIVHDLAQMVELRAINRTN